MPYRFKINEPIEKGFRRIAREQIDASLAELTGTPVGARGVHECRKSLKRLRALVRLTADGLGKGKAEKRVKSLGEIAKLLSARRDQTVMLETIEKLSKESPDAAVALAPLKESIGESVGWNADAQSETLDSDLAARVRLLLLQEAKKFAHAKFGKRGFAALAGGLEASYRAGRKAADYAYEEPTNDNFHDLRKAVQWHWRQMSLLSKAWPDEFAVRVNAARELSTLLGDDHDLAVLSDAATRSATMTEEQKDAAVAVCQHHQQLLRGTAEYRARRLFAEKPEAFVGRVATYWRCSRSLDPRLEVPVAPRQVAAGELAPASVSEVQVPPSEKRAAPAKPRLATKSDTAPPSQRRA